MKKHAILIGVSIICICTTQNVIGQITVPSNTSVNPTDYVGWDATAGGPPLNIKTELNQPIHFYTNAGAGTFNNMRMTILGTNGNIGIGTPTPVTILDVNGTVQAKQILITANGTTNDLLALITELQNEVTQLKKQLSANAKN